MPLSKKVVILGHFGVGKTSLIRQYVDEAFSEDYIVTVGVHVKKKDIEVSDQTVSLIIWDIEGNSSIDKARNSYLLGTHGFVYVFDVGRPETYENITSEMSYLSENHAEVPVSLVGNKCDLFTKDFNETFFSSESFKNCFFTSAKTGENVNEVFMNITKQML
ncbi:MAG: GTP-binding protein [Flavobacteriaceae bacterium]|nr:GTP-binding protein [Flavobacteriaceae bacterium]